MMTLTLDEPFCFCIMGSRISLVASNDEQFRLLGSRCPVKVNSSDANVASSISCSWKRGAPRFRGIGLLAFSFYIVQRLCYHLVAHTCIVTADQAIIALRSLARVLKTRMSETPGSTP